MLLLYACRAVRHRRRCQPVYLRVGSIRALTFTFRLHLHIYMFSSSSSSSSSFLPPPSWGPMGPSSRTCCPRLARPKPLREAGALLRVCYLLVGRRAACGVASPPACARLGPLIAAILQRCSLSSSLPSVPLLLLCPPASGHLAAAQVLGNAQGGTPPSLSVPVLRGWSCRSQRRCASVLRLGLAGVSQCTCTLAVSLRSALG